MVSSSNPKILRDISCGGGGRKADLIRKVLAADLLQLPILPSMEAKEKEITDHRLVKLKVNGITIPFPEDIE